MEIVMRFIGDPDINAISLHTGFQWRPLRIGYPMGYPMERISRRIVASRIGGLRPICRKLRQAWQKTRAFKWFRSASLA